MLNQFKSFVNRREYSWITINDYLFWLGTIFLSLFVPIEWFKAKLSDLHYIWGGGGDSLLSFSFVNSLARGNFPINDHFGAPSGLNWGYYPVGDWTEAGLAAIGDRLIGLGAGLPLIFILSFPITFIFAYWVFKEAHLDHRWSTLAALSYTFIPWHFYRLGHLFLATTYGCVAGVLLICRVYLNEKTSGVRNWILNLILIGVASLSGIYFAAFTLILLAVAQIWRYLRKKNFQFLSFPAIFVISTVIGQAPFYFALPSGQSASQVSARHPIESIIYGGKLLTLILPFSGTRIPILHDLLKLEGSLPADSEAELPSNYGTLISLLCFIGLGIFVFYKLSVRKHNKAPSKLDEVISFSSTSVFVLILFFLAYGPNLIFATLVTAQIRAWNRLTPVIILLVMIFGFASAKKIFQHYTNRMSLDRGLLQVIQRLLPIMLIAVVLLDQVPARGSARGIIDQGIERTQLARKYVSKLDENLAKNCVVLELPLTPFPENPPVVKLPDYELMFPALIDTKLRWSYGVMKNTPNADAYTIFQTMNTKQLIIEAKKLGFCAIHYDSRGYANDTVLHSLTHYLGSPIAQGFQNQWYAFKLATIAK